MRRITKTAVAAGAGAAVLIGGVAAAVPAFAGNGPGPGPAASQAAGYRAGVPGTGNGVRCDLAQWPAGTLTSQQKATLASIAEQEKLSRDLYTALAAARMPRCAPARPSNGRTSPRWATRSRG